MVNDGVNGLLFPSGDAAALVELIVSLYGAPDFRHSLGAEARRTALSRHDKDRIVKELLSTYVALKEVDD